ncbi:uncharacterized protein ACO6RY_19431 [Pungitius sinensis]
MTLHNLLQLHVEYGRIQGDSTVGIVGVLLKRQRQRRRGLLIRCASGFSGPLLLLLLLQSHGQRVAVDVVDPGVVPGRLWSPEEGERVDEAGGPLHCFDRHGVRRLAPGHCTLIHMGSL